MEARSPKQIKAQKSVYLPWLICKLISTIEAWFFHCIGPYFSIVQKRLRYHFETCTFVQFEFMAKSGLQSTLNFILSQMISQL